MKKILLLLAVVLGMAATASAESPVAIGLKLGHATCINQMGLGVDVRCNITDNIRIAPSFDYYFQNNEVSAWDVNANVNYMFDIVDNVDIYPLAGLTFSRWSADGAETVSRFGANFGGGIDFKVMDNLSLNTELKYQLISDFSQCIISMGVHYSF